MHFGSFTAVKDERGYYFIDRDGEYFAPILEFLRTGDFYVPEGAPVVLPELRVPQGCARRVSFERPSSTRSYCLFSRR